MNLSLFRAADALAVNVNGIGNQIGGKASQPAIAVHLSFQERCAVVNAEQEGANNERHF